MKNKILIVAGDPRSINSEIIYKTFKKLSNSLKKRIFIIANSKLLKYQLKKLKYKINFKDVNSSFLEIDNNRLKIINVDLAFKHPFKFNEKELKRYIKKSFAIAHSILINDKSVNGLINCPINKNIMGKNGYGVTEYLASKCSIKDNSEVMVIRNDKLAVVPITTHTDIKNVSKKITKKLIISKISSIDRNYKKIFLKKPKIAILGLNPHNAELRKNSEEIKVIIPAIEKLKKRKINIFGPFVADTIFIDNYKLFDVIVGMYHDQVLAPFKSLNKFNGINLTLGLKYLRVSPDHGVALDLVGKNKANPFSLIECVKFINKFKLN